MKKIIFTLTAILLFWGLNANADLNKCTGCHGAKFDIKALSKSKDVSKMGEIEIAEVLKGYRDGTYGGTYKIMMRAQVVKYDDKALEAMAKEIKNLK